MNPRLFGAYLSTIKSAGRGDQIAKVIQSLITRVSHGTPQSAVGAADTLYQAAGDTQGRLNSFLSRVLSKGKPGWSVGSDDLTKLTGKAIGSPYVPAAIAEQKALKGVMPELPQSGKGWNWEGFLDQTKKELGGVNVKGMLDAQRRALPKSASINPRIFGALLVQL